ncbi:MAG: hypothetical protein A2176_15190 [Spirochaetes bacterium RBG_13_51_14]|nr:MAG: hypothetical protein A2176_15190 [Spirochaetes bacterium RBG_13_51_14]
MENKYRIFIVDDHPIFRYGLSQLINQEPGLIVCGEAENAFESMRAIEKLRPDLVIVDIGLEGPSGLEVIRDIVLKYKKIPILVLSMYEESLYAERVLRLGARGYIMKQGTYETVIEAIYQVLDRRIYLSKQMSENFVSRFVNGASAPLESPVNKLTDRELEVFRLIGKGIGTKEISQMLNLSVNTINTYRDRIKTKLNIKTYLELHQFAIRWDHIENK